MSRSIKIVDGQLIEYEIFKLRDKYDPMLRRQTTPVDFDRMEGTNVSFIAMSLMETCNKLGGLGLSANQCIGQYHSMCAVNMLDENKIYCMINPKILEFSETKSELKEGCLSFPGLLLKVRRPEWVEVEFFAIGGERIQRRYEGITSTIIQHELDHLNGICYTDIVPKVNLEIAQRKVSANLHKMKRMTNARA